MYILNLYIRGFGKLKNLELDFADNKITIIEGNNEAGKSTIHNFIKAMLYGFEKPRGRASKTSLYTKYQPWDKGEYGGYLRVKKENTIYRIERDFYKNSDDSLFIINESSEKRLSNPTDFLNDLTNNLSSTAFSNTISINQLKSYTDDAMTNELKNHIANMNSSANETLNISKASDFLKVKRKDLSNKFNKTAQNKFNSNLEKIKSLEKNISEQNFSFIDDLEKTHSNKLKESSILELEAQNIKSSISAYEEKISSSPFKDFDELLNIKEDFDDYYNRYLDITDKKPSPFIYFLCSLFFILGFASFSFAIYLFVSGQNNPFTKIFSFNYDLSIGIFIALFTVFIILTTSFYRLISISKENENIIKNKLLPFVEELANEELVDDFSLEKTEDVLLHYTSIYEKLDILKIKQLKLDSDIKNLNEHNTKHVNQLNKAQKGKWEIEKSMEEISNLNDENSFLKKQISENHLIEKEIKAIDLAIETINKLSTNIKDSFGFYLNKNASKLLNSLSLEAYNSISIDSDMNVFLHSKTRIVSLEQVSSGTKDQVYLAIRLASAKLLQDKKQSLPLLLDDSFVNYDDTRLLAALKFLDTHYDGQIILFTHLPNPSKCLESNNMQYNLVRI